MLENAVTGGISMQFKSFESGIEVNAVTVASVMTGMGHFTNISRRFLIQVGIGNIEDRKYVLDMDAWYSMDDWLKAFENIAYRIGDTALFNIGASIPKSANFPAGLNDIRAGVSAVDIAYHINHRKNGRLLYNMDTGVMLEGIGHYGSKPISGANEILCVCENPYPCAFDRGIITSMAQQFEPGAQVVHDDNKECRKKGADSCTYHVYW
jgi:hypothetical protein